MDVDEQPSLIVSAKTGDSLLRVQLHPLVILTISDYVTRHTLRRQDGPVVGAILGSQRGRDITMEFAFECKTQAGINDEVVMEPEWFRDRLQQFKEVHKAPPLDLVGWFTLASTAGPQTHHLPIQKLLMKDYNESVLLLTFHPQSVTENASASGEKLPFTIYEPVRENPGQDNNNTTYTEDLRFQELPYTIESGEAEMIGVDFVARGGANATAAPTNARSSTVNEASSKLKPGKGKGKEKESPDSLTKPAQNNVLSPEDEEAIAMLTTKANAIRMLHQRIRLMRAYLNSLPPCYLNTPPGADGSQNYSEPQISHPILRSISTLLARLPLLTPTPFTPSANISTSSSAISNSRLAATATATASEASRERSDVALISLLGNMGSTLSHAVAMGKKARIVEEAKIANSKNNASSSSGFDNQLWSPQPGGGKGGGGGLGDFGGGAYGEEGGGPGAFKDEGLDMVMQGAW